MGMVKDEYIRSGWHWEFGWLRRPDMDDANGYCYEEPDGDLLYFQHRSTKVAAFLDVMRDEKSGDNYLCLSRRIPLRQKIKVKR
jgi:hypothetical protein